MEQFTFFWNGPFSQWYPSTFTMGANTFTRAEQAMMYGKAVLFRDIPVAIEIMNTDDPKVQKALGRKVKNFDPQIWDRYKRTIVYQANHAKFTQNPTLLKALLDTRGTTLVEASPYDRVWGIGLAEHDPLALNRETWKGQNLLGEILTELREDLIKGGAKQ